MIFNYEPQITEKDKDSIAGCITAGIATPSVITSFNNELTNVLQVPTVCCSSGTSALHVALLSLGLSKNDEIICPSISFASTWNVIEYIGATPIICDISPTTWCIDPDEIEAHITPRTKALISVDLYGNPCNYDKLIKICKKYDLKLIIDGAQSLGSLYDNLPCATYGDVACTSFNLNKIITSCGGGSFSSPNSDRLATASSLINQCKLQSGYDYHDVGYNYRLNSINAALGLSQLKRLKDILKQKKQIYGAYSQRLKDYVSLQETTPLGSPNYWMVIIRLDTSRQQTNIEKILVKNNIECKTVFKPVTSLQWFRQKYGRIPSPHGESFYSGALSLPCGLGVTDSQIDNICSLIIKNLT